MKLPCTLFGIKADYENSTINTLKVTSFEEKFFGVVECTFNGATFVTELLEGTGNESKVRLRVRSNGILREFEALIVKGKESGLLLDINTGVVVGENSAPVKFNNPVAVKDIELLHEDVVIHRPKYSKDYTNFAQEAKESENNAKRILEKVRSEHEEFLNAEKMQKNQILDNITESFNIHVDSVINERLKPVIVSARKTVSDLKEISNNVSSDIDTKIDLIEKVITDRVNSLFINHSETTKHSFSKFVSDIEDTSIQKWYTTLSESFINDATDIAVKNEHALEGKYTDLINEVRKVSQERLNSIQDECNSLFEELNNHISLVKSSIDNSNVLTEESIERIQKSTNKYISEFKDVCLNETTSIIKNVSLDISDIVENYIYEKYDNIVDDKFKSLLESFEKNRKDELIIERSNTLEKTKKEILSSLKTEIANQFSTLKRYAEMVSGGGTVAVQYAQGGIINGELAIINPTGIALSTIGRILSGGVDLSTIIASIAPSVSAFSTFAVPGQGNVVADSLSDVITLSAGSNITITTDPATDTVIFSANGGTASATTFLSGGNLSASNVQNALLELDTDKQVKITYSDTPPLNPQEKDEWYDTTSTGRFIYYSGYWVEVSGTAYPSNGSKAQDNPPTSPNVGDLWYDTTVGSLYVYLSGAWVESQGNAIDSAGIIAALGYTPLPNNGSVGTLIGTGFFNVNGTIGATIPATGVFTSVTSTTYTNIPGLITTSSISVSGNTALSVFATDTIKTFIVPVSAGVSAFTATITLNVSAPVPQNGATTVVRVNLPASTNPRIQLRSNVTVIGEAIGNGIARTVTFRCNFDGSAWFIASRLPSTEKFLFTRPSAPAGSVWTSPYWSFTSPVGAREMTGYIIGSTGGGGSGARGAAGTHRCGGNGSDGASIGFTKSPYIVSNTPLRIQLGAGGVGGVAVTVDSTAGNPGTNGGQSLLNDQTIGGNGYNIINVNGSPLGRGGNLGSTPNAVNDTPSYLIYYYGTAGIRGASGATSGGGQSYTNAGPAGGAGGGLDTADTLRNGATGGRNVTWWIGYDNTGGVAPGGSGMNAISGIPPEMETAGGAGGGASAIAVAGGNGGEGYKGGGAGGGGASTNGFNSGAGGNGSDAWAWLTFFY